MFGEKKIQVTVKIIPRFRLFSKLQAHVVTESKCLQSTNNLLLTLIIQIHGITLRVCSKKYMINTSEALCINLVFFMCLQVIQRHFFSSFGGRFL